MKNYIAGLACALSMFSVGCTAENVPPLTKEVFIASAEKRVKEAGLPGVAVAVVKPDGRYWATGFGYANLDTKKPMTENTVISIGSVSKTLTGTALMQLVEKGKVDLNGDINEYLSFKVENPKKPGKTITPRHVLTHTTGILDSDVYGSPVVYHFGGDNPVVLGDFLKDYLSVDGKYYSSDDNFAGTDPGEHYEYSNIVYGLAGHLVEAASGQAFNEYTKENIFKPLGMNATGWRYHEVNADDLGMQYERVGGDYPEEAMRGGEHDGWRAVVPYGLATYPDGGLRSSVSDLSHFLAAIMNDGSYKGARILSEETVKEMLTPQEFGAGKIKGQHELIDQGITFAMEPFVSMSEEWVLPGHSGSDPGTSTFMYFDPKRDVGVIFFTNSGMYKKEQMEAAQSITKDLFENAAAFIGK